jgi:hypothetical protein
MVENIGAVIAVITKAEMLHVLIKSSMKWENKSP